jgi:dihydrofolate reductase
MKLVVTEFISLDGVVEAPGGEEGYKHTGWTIPYWNDEIAMFKLDEVFTCDAFLLGRITYESFAGAWPTRTDEMGFADRMNSLPKYVASTTLKEASWNNSSILTGDIYERVFNLKQQPGQDLLIAGSCTLAQSLMPCGLIDEFRLLVYPVILGSGMRLFGRDEKIDLKLLETKAFGSGVVLQRYLTP